MYLDTCFKNIYNSFLKFNFITKTNLVKIY